MVSKIFCIFAAEITTLLINHKKTKVNMETFNNLEVSNLMASKASASRSTTVW